MIATAIAVAFAALSLGLASPVTVRTTAPWGLSTDASVVACANGFACNQAASTWISCQIPTGTLTIIDCLKQISWVSTMGECVNCLSNEDTRVWEQLESLGSKLLSLQLPIPQFVEEAYHMGIAGKFPLFLPNATLIQWDAQHHVEILDPGESAWNVATNMPQSKEGRQLVVPGTYGQPNDPVVEACAYGSDCQLSAMKWAQCNKGNPSSFIECVNNISWTASLISCLICLEFGNPFVLNQFQAMVPGITAGNVSVSVIKKNLRKLDTEVHFPLFLPNATLKASKGLLPSRVRQLGDPFNDVKVGTYNGTIGDHFPDSHPRYEALAVGSLEKRKADVQICLDTPECLESANIFDWCIHEPSNTNRAAFDCLCNTYGTAWKNSTFTCASCIVPSIPLDLPPRSFFPYEIDAAMNYYCKSIDHDISPSLLEANGSAVSTQYRSPINFFGITAIEAAAPGSPIKRQSDAEICLESQQSGCSASAEIFDWCVNCQPDHKNTTVTWDCLCKTYINEWKSTTSACASCIEPHLSLATFLRRDQFHVRVESAMDVYCNYTASGMSTIGLLANGNLLTSQWESPLLFFNITIPTGPFDTEGP